MPIQNRSFGRRPGEPAASPKAYPAEAARQGDIVLDTRTRRLIFIGGLVLAVLIVLVLRLAA